MAKGKSKPSKVAGPLTVEEDEEFVLLEPDETYKAKFIKAELFSGNYGPYFKLTFKILDGNLEDGKSAKNRMVTRLLDAKLSPSKPLYKFACVMAGVKDLKKGQKFEFKTYYGERYRAYIKHREDKKDKSKKFEYVDSIKPIKKAAATTSPKEKAE